MSGMPCPVQCAVQCLFSDAARDGVCVACCTYAKVGISYSVYEEGVERRGAGWEKLHRSVRLIRMWIGFWFEFCGMKSTRGTGGIIRVGSGEVDEVVDEDVRG